MKKTYFTSKTVSALHFPVTCLSVIGCSGHPVLKMVLKKIADKGYIDSVRDEHNVRVKLSGHLCHNAENIQLFEKHHIKAVLIYKDPRDNLKHLVYRSLYDYCPKKFTRPNTHPNAVKFHELVKCSEGKRGAHPFVEFYVDTMGAKPLLYDIFQVASWKDHPWVHAVKFEALTDFREEDQGVQFSAVEGIADFLGISLPKTEIKAIAGSCFRKIRKKKKKDEYMVGWEELFSEEDKALFKKYFGKLLIDLGYEKDNNW